MRLSEQLKQDHDSGDFGNSLEGYSEQAAALEYELEDQKKLLSSCKDISELMMVEWLDSASNPGWQSKDECKVDITKCQTIGFVVDENDDGICMALNRTITSGFKPFGELISIPKVAILNIYNVIVIEEH